jgi:hypothetical protein
MGNRRDCLFLAFQTKFFYGIVLLGLVRLASQPAVLFSYTNSAPATSHQPVSSIFLSQQISTSQSNEALDTPEVMT